MKIIYRAIMLAVLLGLLYLIAVTPVHDEVRVLNETVVPAQGAWLLWVLLGMLAVGPIYQWLRDVTPEPVQPNSLWFASWAVILVVSVAALFAYRYAMKQHEPVVTVTSEWIELR